MKINPLAIACLNAIILPALAFHPSFGKRVGGGLMCQTQVITNMNLRHASVTDESTEAITLGRQELSPAYVKAKDYVMATVRDAAPPGFPMEKWDGFIG